MPSTSAQKQPVVASLTDSIFGPSSSPIINHLFAESGSTPPSPLPASPCKRRRTNTNKESLLNSSSERPVKEQIIESRDDALCRRLRQSQDKVLDQCTISIKDYKCLMHGDMEELYADVRGLMKHHGLVIIRNVILDEEVSDIFLLANAHKKRICDALDAKTVPYNSDINDRETFCFQEVAIRCRGRMDVRITDDNDECKLPSLHLIDNLAASILHGAEAPHLVYAGWIFSFTDSADQPWHQDGSPLFDKGTELLPSYAINVFVGLHDEKLLELGPTEFIMGSHCLEPNAAMNKVDSAVSVILGRGDILLYDYRICHRGTSNLCQPEEDDNDTSSDGIRKVLYRMYARPWFREHLNFGKESLFTS
jgi:ectoine hydroxylase-related dioxygenase (phytanoyl-CoA dioxygenase family)